MSSSMEEHFNKTRIHASSHNLLDTIFTYDGNFMLAAIISLLLVILFVLLLHVYAQWFLTQARQRRQNSINVSHVLGPARFHTFTFDTTSLSASSPAKGLDPSAISSIPLFVYDSDEHNGNGLDIECVVCLSSFEDGDVGRTLPKCQHVFHVECIDMWLQSHCSCPVCRAPVVCEKMGEETHGRGSIIDVGSAEECAEAVLSGDEILIDLSNSGNEDIRSQSFASQESMASSSLGCSLKRMLSRNRSEHKVFRALNCESESNV